MPGRLAAIRPGSDALFNDALFREASERLKALQRLRDSGLISAEECQDKRKQILRDR